MRMRTAYVVPALLLTLALVGCALTAEPVPEPIPTTPSEPTPEPIADTPPPARPAPTETPAPQTGTSPLPEPGLSPISPLPGPPMPAASAAVAYLADELGITPQEVTVLASEPVEWADASLGCPQPGMMYAQVITPGYSFLLDAAGKQYKVHTDLTGQSVIVCQPGSGDLNDPEVAFRRLLAHLIQTAPGLGLDQQEAWTDQDITKAATMGTHTWAWRSGEWTLEMTFHAVPMPDYESVLFHQQAGTAWSGTLQANGQVTRRGD
jgi:hypothetical protein